MAGVGEERTLEEEGNQRDKEGQGVVVEHLAQDTEVALSHLVGGRVQSCLCRTMGQEEGDHALGENEPV